MFLPSPSKKDQIESKAVIKTKTDIAQNLKESSTNCVQTNPTDKIMEEVINRILLGII